MLRTLAILAILAIVIAVAVGAAASLTVNGGVIQGGEDNDLTCDTDGVEVVAYALNTYAGATEGVEYITVSGIPAACDGARILGRLYTPGLPYGDYVYTSGIGPGPGYSFVIAAGNSTTQYKLFLKETDYATQIYVPAEYIESVKLWLEGETP